VEELQQYWQKDRVFNPSMDEAKRNDLQKNWKRAVRAAQAWTDEN
jgi:glycerol kinase